MITINKTLSNAGKASSVVYGNDGKKPDKTAETPVRNNDKPNTDTFTMSGGASETKTTDYSKFYKGSESIASYGSGTATKDTVVHYRFDTTDEEGNKIMEKMSKEETMQALNEISSQYGDNVIIEFSGDALGKIFDYKPFMNMPAEHKEIPADMITYFDPPTPLTDEQLTSSQLRNNGTDMEDVMRHFDPDAYKEYLSIKSDGLAKGTTEGIVAGMRYLLKWIDKSCQGNPDWLKSYDPTKTAKQSVSDRHSNVDVYVADDNKTIDMFAGNKLFGVLLSKESAYTLRSGNAVDKDWLLKSIDNGIKVLTDMNEKLAASGKADGFKFGLSITGFRKLSFVANDGNNTFSAATADELMKTITG